MNDTVRNDLLAPVRSAVEARKQLKAEADNLWPLDRSYRCSARCLVAQFRGDSHGCRETCAVNEEMK